MMQDRLRIILLAPLALLFGADGAARLHAQESDEVLERWMSVYGEAAKSVDMDLSDEPGAELKLQKTPLLKYTNPVRNVKQHGAIYLWTVEDRPGVIASFWSAVELSQPNLRRLNFEWHSLSEEPVSADRFGERLWDATEPGLEWKRLSEVPPPAASRALRLLQMRRIASSFSAEIDTQESELRLIPQPLFRYPSQADRTLDGAIFAYVMGTDPELLLLIESRSGEGGTEEWYSGFARFTNYGVVVQRDGQQWWSCAQVQSGQRTGRYYLRLAVERLPADLESGRAPESGKVESK